VNTPVKSLSNLLKSSLKRVEREISKNIKDEEKLITLTAGHLIKAKGKKIRPLLTLIVSKMLNYKGNADVTLAVCIEFIHNATLLHDDVIDTGKIRRGKLSANQIWGNKVSVLVGDYLLSRAFKLMVKNKSLKLLEILSQTSLILARGQIQDVGNNQNVNLTEKKYLSIIDAKTAELFRISCFLPTIITDQDKRTQKIFNDFGFNFGMAFQLSDDVLDYFGDSGKMGKSVGKDFFEGKVTYPVIHCFKKSDKKSKKIIAKLFFKRKRSKKDLALILDLMKKTNTYKSSIEFVGKYAEKAKTKINKFEGNKYKVYLDDLVDHLIIRDK
jgi:octaprenyl-diphosphate synthase